MCSGCARLGIEVAIGHDAKNLGDAAVVVVSSAIKRDNPELKEARARGLPVVRRAEMLAELMRLKSAIAVGGTHGKTTTTSMVAALLDAGGLDPTVINGGIINSYGTNARIGTGDWMVVESDESDGTFVKLPADIAIVTNIDPEHLDHYGTFDRLREAFVAFVENVPFYGFAVMCLDHPEVQALIAKIEDRRIITYGRNPQAEVRYRDIAYEAGRSRFVVERRDRLTGETETIDDLFITMPGEHNVSNATAAIAVARAIDIPADAIRKGLAGFGGVKRRFTLTGTWNGVADLRRLRPSPGGDRRGASCRARRCHGTCHRGGAAAPLYAAEEPLRGFLHLLQRGRYGHRRGRLSGRRGADRGRQPRRAGGGAALRRPPRRAGAGERGGAAGADRGYRQAGRHGGVPRRGLDHALGQCAAGRA